MRDASRSRSQHILFVTQVYSPDPAAVARLMADAANALVERGARVTVLSADRGYDNPAVRYRSGTTPEGVVVRRLPFSSFGKRRMALRVVAGVSFTLQAAVRGLVMRRLQTVVVSTSPPMGALAGVILGSLRRISVIYWPMDLNPDQTIALGLKSDRALTVRLLDWVNRAILKRATAVIALDRFMAQRLEHKYPCSSKTVIIPPWPEQDDIEPLPHESNPFRRAHGLEGKTVIMYSGTLSPSNPLDTLLDAAETFQEDPRLVFVFVGGGLGMQDVRSRALRNVLCLPYEPLERMRYSLAAADVHVVSLGEPMVGIVHPCKVYGAMSAARPILFLGPDQSHVTDMMAESEFGWHVRHGDVAGARAVIKAIVDGDPAGRRIAGERARALIQRTRTKAVSSARIAAVVAQAETGSPIVFSDRRAAVATDA